MAENSISLLFGEKGRVLCERIFSHYHRFPFLIKKPALRELSCFLSHCSESFLDSRSVVLLTRIFFSFHRLARISYMFGANSQKISLKAIRINPSVYGISIALFSLQDSERFNDNHILKGIQNLIPGIVPIPFSYLSYQYKSLSFYYLEIKKVRGRGFTQEDKEKLQSKLLHEFQKTMESSNPSLFLPGNEEELFKNIRYLCQEIKSIHDLPQVMISFVEFSPETIKCLVIVLRALKPETPSLAFLSGQLPSMIQFSLEKAFCVGYLRKKYPKEASIFTLEVKSSHFVRSKQPINLRSARLYIAKAMESMLGPFRDYNGGLLNKENEQLMAMKRELPARNLNYPFLDDLFYSIKPLDMRAIITVETGLELAKAIDQMLIGHLEKGKKYAITTVEKKELSLAVIKTQEKMWKVTLPAQMLSYSPQFAYAALELDGYLYLCFFQQYAAEELLFDALQKVLAGQDALSVYPRKLLLNLNFQSGDPLSLNPRLAADMPCHILSNLLFEGLTRVNRAGEIKLAACAKYEVSGCKKIYTFTLKPSWWSNGEEVTAYHFENTWKRALLAPMTGCPYPDFFFLIKNVKRVREKEISVDEVGIEAKDAKTLLVTLEEPCPYFLDLLATPPFFPLLGEGEEPLDFNGPFTVAEWKRNSFLHLSQNPFYREAQSIKLGGIKISMIRDPYVAFEKFQKGEIDFLGDPISPLPPEILKRPEVHAALVQKQISRIFWIHCNPRSFPLNNVHIRRALNWALNRKQITERVLVQQIPQISPLPSKYAHLKEKEYNVELARAEFQLGLQELGIDKENFPPLVLTHSDLSFEKPLFEELKAQWKKVLGVKLIAQHLRWNEFSASLEKGNFQLCGLYRRDFFNNALFFLNFFKASSINPHSLDNEEYSRLLTQFDRGDTKEETLRKIEALLIDQSPVIPLVNQRYLALISPHIQGIGWDENGCLDLREAWIEMMFS